MRLFSWTRQMLSYLRNVTVVGGIVHFRQLDHKQCIYLCPRFCVRVILCKDWPWDGYIYIYILSMQSCELYRRDLILNGITPEDGVLIAKEEKKIIGCEFARRQIIKIINRSFYWLQNSSSRRWYVGDSCFQFLTMHRLCGVRVGIMVTAWAMQKIPTLRKLHPIMPSHLRIQGNLLTDIWKQSLNNVQKTTYHLVYQL